MRQRQLLLWMAWWALRPVAGDPVGLAAYDLSLLSQLRTGTAHLASSADPTGGNGDRGHFLRRDGSEAVLLDAQGPGMITRIWSANPQGTLRVYFDHEAIARVTLPLARLADETNETPTVTGWTSAAGGAVSCWYPMPFQQHCKVVVDGADQLYYQVDYTTWPAGTAVKTFTPGPVGRLAGYDWGQASEAQVTIPAGGAAKVLDHTGAATIRRLVLQFTPESFAALRSLRCRMSWDDAAPSVDAPLLDLFAAGHGAAQYLSAVTAVAAWNLFQLDAPLPFARRGVVELLNAGQQTVKVKASAYLVPSRRPDDGYFHAAYAASTTVAGQPHHLLAVTGRGQFVGAAVALTGDDGLKYLEGDETITVDGREKLQGTGTEDWFNSGWYFRRGPFGDLYAGAPLLAASKSRVAAYRWNVGDCVPFRQQLAVDLQHGGNNNAPGCGYRSVAFYYASSPQAVPAVKELPAAPAHVELKSLKSHELDLVTLADQLQTSGVAARVAADTSASLPTAGGQMIEALFTGREGARLTVPFAVERSGLYDIALHVVAGGPTFDVKAKVDDDDVLPPTAPSGLGEPVLRLGRARVSAGRHALSLLATPTTPGGGPFGMLGLDQLLLQDIGTVAGAIEAEDLQFAVRGAATAVVQMVKDLPAETIRAADVEGGAVPTDAVWSGGAQVKFTPTKAGQTVAFRFTVPEAGLYGLAASLMRGPEYGACDVLLDGRRRASVDGRADVPQVGGRTGLGTVYLRAGTHRLALRAVDHGRAPAPVGLDYLLVTPATRGQEAELCRVLDQTGVELRIKERFGAEPRWSGGAYLRMLGRNVGDRVQLLLDAPRAGRYRVTIKPVALPTGGKFELRFSRGGRVALDSFAAAEQPGRAVAVKVVLRRGGNRVIARLTDTTTGADLALDSFELQYLGWPVGWRLGAAGVAVGLLLAGWLLARRRRAGKS